MFRILIATSAFALTAATAEAATMKAVYTGTVHSGYDQTDEFGTGGTSLDGLSYVLTYIYDTALGQRNTYADSDEVYGGEAYGAGVANPMLSATLTINGKSFSVGGNYQGGAFVQSDDASYTYYNHHAHDNEYDGVKYLSNYLYQFNYWDEGTVPDLDLGTTLTDTTDYTYSGYFQKYEYDYGTITTLAYAYGYLDPDKLVITRYDGTDPGPAPVPLPASLGLMAAAIGGLGAMARKRRAA